MLEYIYQSLVLNIKFLLVEKQTITLCLRGKQEGQRKLYKACAPYVYATIKRYIWETEDIKDTMQEVFVNIFKNIKTFDDTKGTFNGWIRKIAINQSLMFIRKNKKISHLVPLDEVQNYSLEATDSYEKLSREDVEKVLEKVPNGYRIVFTMYVIDGYDHKEIAKLLNIKVQTSRSQLARAKKWICFHLFNNEKSKAYGLF